MSLFSSGAVTVADYRVQTGDNTTAASSVSAALIEGQSLLEEHLRRRLENVERTGRFPIEPDGRVYPDAYPITASATFTIDGRALVGVPPDTGPFIGVFTSVVPLKATVTWTGGFTPATFPRTLAHALYDLAEKLVATDPTPAGRTLGSAHVGDVSVTFNTVDEGGSELDAYVPGLSARVRKYRNRWITSGGVTGGVTASTAEVFQ